MNRATSLTVIALGAILAFAISASPSFLNVQIVGWILMATGAAGLLLQGRGRDWLRRTVIVRSSPEVTRVRRRRPAQIATRPPADPAYAANPADPADPAEPTGSAPADRPTQPIAEPVERETIEEYMEQ